MTDLLEEVRQIISKQFGVPEEDIEEDTLLDEDLSITDLDMEDLIAILSQKYDIEIPSQETASFKKVSDIVAYLYDHVEATT